MRKDEKDFPSSSFVVRDSRIRVELPDRPAPGPSPSGYSDHGTFLRRSGGNRIHLRAGQTASNAPDPRSSTIPESIANILRELDIKFEQQLSILQQLSKHIESDRGKFDEHGYRWLRDCYGRVIGCEEQWQFDAVKLREFIEYKFLYSLQQQHRKRVDVLEHGESSSPDSGSVRP